MPTFLLDNNHVGAALRKVSLVRDRIHQQRRLGHRFGTCVPVLCELEAGIVQTQDVADRRRRLRQLLTRVSIWPLEPQLARSYGIVYHQLRQAGRSMSQVDMLLAALARQRSLTLLTSDRDFEALPDIHTENWLV